MSRLASYFLNLRGYAVINENNNPGVADFYQCQLDAISDCVERLTVDGPYQNCPKWKVVQATLLDGPYSGTVEIH